MPLVILKTNFLEYHCSLFRFHKNWSFEIVKHPAWVW